MPKNFNMDAMTIHEVANPKMHMYRSISVIATFNRKGDMEPVAIRFETENERFDVRIDRVVSSSKEWDTILFQCLVTVGNQQQQIKLAYEISEHIWRLI